MVGAVGAVGAIEVVGTARGVWGKGAPAAVGDLAAVCVRLPHLAPPDGARDQDRLTRTNP